MHCSSKKLERKAREATDKCLLVLKESNKRGFDTYIHLIYNLYSPYVQPIYTLYATYIHFIFNLYSLYTPYLQPIFTYVNLIVNLYSPIYTLYTTYIRHLLTIVNNHPSSPNGLLTQRPCNLYTVKSGIRHNKRLHYTPLVPLIVLLLSGHHSLICKSSPILTRVLNSFRT